MKSLEEIVEMHRQRWIACRPKLGRWVYCKYCYKNVRPEIGPDYSIIICTECGYGLAPADEVCDFGSYQAWEEHINAWFIQHCIDNGYVKGDQNA